MIFTTIFPRTCSFILAISGSMSYQRAVEASVLFFNYSASVFDSPRKNNGQSSVLRTPVLWGKQVVDVFNCRHPLLSPSLRAKLNFAFRFGSEVLPSLSSLYSNIFSRSNKTSSKPGNLSSLTTLLFCSFTRNTIHYILKYFGSFHSMILHIVVFCNSECLPREKTSFPNLVFPRHQWTVSNVCFRYRWSDWSFWHLQVLCQQFFLHRHFFV